MADEDHPGPGRIERMTRADIEAMVSEHPMGEALAEGVIAASRVLDDPNLEAKSYAGIMREWRAGLMELAKYAAASADDLDDELSAPSEGEHG